MTPGRLDDDRRWLFVPVEISTRSARYPAPGGCTPLPCVRVHPHRSRADPPDAPGGESATTDQTEIVRLSIKTRLLGGYQCVHRRLKAVATNLLASLASSPALSAASFRSKFAYINGLIRLGRRRPGNPLLASNVLRSRLVMHASTVQGGMPAHLRDAAAVKG